MFGETVQQQQARLTQQPVKPHDQKQHDNMILNFMKQNPQIIQTTPSTGPPPQSTGSTSQPLNNQGVVVSSVPPSISLSHNMTLQAPGAMSRSFIRPVSPAPPSLMPPPTSPRAASPVSKCSL